MYSVSKSAGEQKFLSQLQRIQIRFASPKNIGKQDLIGFLRNLTTLINNGVSVPQALETLLSDVSYRKYNKLIRSLLDTVKSGSSLSAALQHFPDSFPSLMVHQIRVGEKAGSLQTTLGRIVRQLENSSRIRSFIIKKTTYPMVLLLAGAGSVSFMLTSVIPAFQKMYEQSGATLPGITEFVIGLSSIAHDYGAMVIAFAVALVLGLVAASRQKETRIRMDQMMLNMPLLGIWLRNLAILQFTETLSNLLESGFNLVDALPEAAKSVNNRFMRSRLLGLHRAIRQGERFSVALQREQHLLPPIVKQLVVIGERTGRLSEITAEIHAHLNTEVERKTAALLGALEPVLTTCLAIVIGGILLAVYLPMFDMIGTTRP